MWYRRVRHALRHLWSAQPDRTLRIFLVPNLILLFLLDIDVFSWAAVVTSEGLIVASVGGVSNLKGAKQWLWFLKRHLRRELFSSAVSHHLGIKWTVLADVIGEGLVPEVNFWIVQGIISANHIFFTLIGIFSVANFIQVGERLWVFLNMKSFLSLYFFNGLLSVIHVFKFWLLHAPIAMHVYKWLILVAQSASRPQEILSLITVGVSYAVG